MSARELGPIVGVGRVEQSIRDVLRDPRVLGAYMDEAHRQTYGSDVGGEDARIARPKDIVCSTDDYGRLTLPAIIVQAEASPETHRTGDRILGATWVVGVHCAVAGGSEATNRRTADVWSSAATALLLQRLPGVAAGPAVISGVEWDGTAIEEGDGDASFIDAVVQLRITVSGLLSDRRGRLPDLPDGGPGTTDPAPQPGIPPVVEEIEIEAYGDPYADPEEGP